MSSGRDRSEGISKCHGSQAIVEIAAELAFLDELLKRQMSRAEQADVGARGAIRADGPDLPVFEEAEKLHLNIHGKIADLVEKKGSAMGLHQRARALMSGAGEGAFDVTEEFALGKRKRQVLRSEAERRDPMRGRSRREEGPRRLLCRCRFLRRCKAKAGSPRLSSPSTEAGDRTPSESARAGLRRGGKAKKDPRRPVRRRGVFRR